jgi:hypothetical protein
MRRLEYKAIKSLNVRLKSVNELTQQNNISQRLIHVIVIILSRNFVLERLKHTLYFAKLCQH